MAQALMCLVPFLTSEFGAGGTVLRSRLCWRSTVASLMIAGLQCNIYCLVSRSSGGSGGSNAWDYCNYSHQEPRKDEIQNRDIIFAGAMAINLFRLQHLPPEMYSNI
jgi:hypothetical protein